SDDIEKICRLDNGKRLVSVLKPSSLLQYPSVQKAFDEAHHEDQTMEQQQDNDLDLDSDNEQMVVFKLADQEYGISIEDVQEITRVPEKLDKVPKTASFIDGMVNLRGTILPVVDMRTRFDMNRIEASDRQRILVVNIDSVKTGFVVDSVSEVLRLSKRQIEDAPPLSDDQNRMLGKVVNLSQRNRIIQILSARELLSANEQTIVANQLG
ncbi:MAG: chemotaxis protein CheW, partial [Pseudomonadota bacterium]|nr:chemotaxis protein CheW [Pseudomonadota bacterium]